MLVDIARMPHAYALILTALTAGLLLPPSASGAGLQPKDVAVVANRTSPASLDVARYYAARRGVPPTQILTVSVPLHEDLPRDAYERDVVQPLREQLVERGLAGRVRVLVSTFGMPLRVLAPVPDAQRRSWLADAQARDARARREQAALIDALRRVGLPDGSAAPVEPHDPPSAAALTDRVVEELRNAARRLRSNAGGRQVDQAKQELLRIVLALTGTIGTHALAASGAAADEGQAELPAQQVMTARAVIQALIHPPSDESRKQAYRLARRLLGVQGVVRLASAEIALYDGRDADASLDSELSLLWWDSPTYPAAGRIRNPYYWATSRTEPSSPFPFPTVPPLLMVSRLDAPTAELAKGLVDKALEAEEGGLHGRVYLDARGLPPGPAGTPGFYDASLRRLADEVRRRTPHDVVLEETERRFSRPGEAPDAAVYVGWYRLRSYEDAFVFNPGALGYHIASGEAISLHAPTETGWCKNALERGITATLGAVAEPWLDAFPLPDRFVGLLLTGRYSLVEAYYLTSPYVSWRMVLVGDPLYTPWSARDAPPVPEDLPVPPSARPPVDPLTARASLQDARAALQRAVSHILSADRP